MPADLSTAPPARPLVLLRLRAAAYAYVEDAGAPSWSARLAGTEILVALLWGAALLGIVAAMLLVPHLPLAAAAALLGLESAALAAAIALAATWARGHRTPVLTHDRLTLEGPLGDHDIALVAIARVEIRPLLARDPPISRVIVVRHNGGRAFIDLPRRDALVLCRALQRRLFGDAPAPPRHDAACATLDRARTPVRAWMARLHEQFARTGYRHAAGIAEDDLDRALHDAALPASRRVGAALAVCAAAGDEGCARVQHMAARLEAPALRIAVAHAAQGTLDEAAIEEAEAEDIALGRGSADRLGSTSAGA